MKIPTTFKQPHSDLWLILNRKGQVRDNGIIHTNVERNYS